VKARELADYLFEKVARFKVPRYWEFRDSLPHTPSERVAKHELEAGRASFLEDTIDLRNR
jgi:crotonobetaine/carnitine-CoA ligase